MLVRESNNLILQVNENVAETFEIFLNLGTC